ncbi:hypothetical protein PVAP13_4KG309925 [Panicum virgatum]|uniref:BED-type domain-containing protein n=1 Tax=Panicum virgatum TaxID=38727 RepID=A0A8T0TPQ9_PANVG|nr:hypothetical protein PVAP13_4KG309925 [Panicum virgatum]
MAENMEGREVPGAVTGRRSEVWNHFDVFTDRDGNVRATCKRCHSSLGADTKNGTRHLKRHLESVICTRQQQRRPGSSAIGRPGDEPPVPPPPTNCAPSETSLQAAYPAQLGSSGWSSNNQEECVAELAPMVAFHGYPSSIVEDECFRRFASALNPRFQMPSRAAVESVCAGRAVDAMRQLRATLAACSGRISLVADTTETGKGRALYMACQFIDGEWGLHKRTLQVFRVMRFPPYGHSALLGAEDVCLNVPEVIQKQFTVPGPSDKLEEAARRWGLGGRLFSVAWGGVGSSSRRAWSTRISSTGSERRRLTLSSLLLRRTASPTPATCWSWTRSARRCWKRSASDSKRLVSGPSKGCI